MGILPWFGLVGASLGLVAEGVHVHGLWSDFRASWRVQGVSCVPPQLPDLAEAVEQLYLAPNSLASQRPSNLGIQ